MRHHVAREVHGFIVPRRDGRRHNEGGGDLDAKVGEGITDCDFVEEDGRSSARRRHETGSRRHCGRTRSSSTGTKATPTASPIERSVGSASIRVPMIRVPSARPPSTTTKGGSWPGTAGWCWTTKLKMVPLPNATT